MARGVSEARPTAGFDGKIHADDLNTGLLEVQLLFFPLHPRLLYLTRNRTEVSSGLGIRMVGIDATVE